MAMLATLMNLSANTATAGKVETLLMPGRVSAAHAKIEENCAACHDLADRLRQTPLCLDCHKDIARDIHAGRGAHGHMPNGGKSQCRACHTEHKGRDGDIVGFSPAGFDHNLTDFALQGAHVGTECGACHRQGEPYRKADTACVACHRGQDVHKGALSEKCADCHESTAWSVAHFDHAKTDFPLRDAHRKIECDACHFGARYKGTPKRCVDCHAPDDVHKRSRGDDCGKCHGSVGWRTAKFDHARETGFALQGAHGDLECAACHVTGNFKDKLAKDCNGCHRSQDVHSGRFGRDCASCHGEVRWKPDGYDHAKLTQFSLLGAHARLDCHGCHTADTATQKLATDCAGCHRAQDPHGGKLGSACDQCHGNESWRGHVRFDHDLTKYPLLGQHVLASCAQCHASLNFSDAATSCVACHRAQDVHKGSLGEECASCHSPNGWNNWEFDHAKQTGFALTGAHRKLDCAGCHREPPKKVKLSTDCASCHAKDDIHVGEFGRQCERCHSTSNFSAARIH
jgi:hypothetical protein